MPGVYTPVQSVALGLDNTVWLAMRTEAAGTRYLVMNDRGDPIGSLLLPPRSRLLQATARRVWLSVTDADGLASVVRYRLLGLR